VAFRTCDVDAEFHVFFVFLYLNGLFFFPQVLNSGEMDGMKSVLLLTDGMPNVVPPRGHLAMLKQYKEETGMECTISTFGFGYALDSELLKDLAREVRH